MKSLPILLFKYGYPSVFPFLNGTNLTSSLEKSLVDENLPLFKKERISVYYVQ